MRTLWQTLLSIIITFALIGVGFYLGTQQTLIADAAASVGLDGLLPD